MHFCEFFQPADGNLWPCCDYGVIRHASQDFQDILEAPRRSACLPVSFQSEPEMIVSQRKIPIEVNGLAQRALRLSHDAEVFEDQRLIEMDGGIQPVTNQQPLSIFSRGFPIAMICKFD